MSSGDPLITLEDIEVHFEDGGGLFDFSEPEVVQAVDGVDLDIYENDVIALVGESGCGKTTLGKTTIGLQRPTGGSIKYKGQDIWDAKDGRGDVDIPYKDIRRRLQIIHQDPGSSLNPNRRVRQVLEAPLKRWQGQMSSGDRRREILSMLERVDMTPPEDYAGRYPHQLSGGEKQRVALIRALLMDPDLILADEAVSALDVSLRVEMMDLMLELQDNFDTSFVFVSHDLSNARYLAANNGGRIGVMYLGRLVEIGPAEQIINDPKHPYTKVLRWATPDLDPDNDAGPPPVRKLDVPDPKNPPSGCRFHTRCPKIIPPEDVDIDQETYNDIMTLRHDIDDRTVEVDQLFESVGVEPETDADRRDNADAFVDAALTEYFDGNVTSPHRDRVEDAIEAVAVGEWDEASTTLSERYESVCERKDPTLDQSSDHPVACHLYTDTETGSPEPAPMD